jgi:hypothetical protein
MDSAGGFRHGGPRPPRADDELRSRTGAAEGSFTEKRHRAGAGGLAGEVVSVTVITWHTAEEVTGLAAGADATVIELDVGDEHSVRIAHNRFRSDASDHLAEEHGTAHGCLVLANPEEEAGGETSKCRSA